MDQPKHDAESLAMEEQFGIPSLELDFGEEGRLLVNIDGRKAARECNEVAARIERLATRRKGPAR